MDVDTFLSRFEKVRQTKPGEWVARCPAHADKSPSLSMKENGGYWLIHCFGGCEPDAIIERAGLTFSDLFPDRLPDNSPRRGAFTAMDVLRCLAFESSVVAIAVADAAEGKPVDASRMCVSAGRIAEALDFVHGR